MAREYLISITYGGSTVWLTSDGLNTGRRCRTETPGVDSLFETESGNTTVAAGGSPFTEKPLTAGKGRPFEIHIPSCPTARFTALVTLKDAAVAASGAATVTFAGEPGSKTVSAVFNFAPTPVSFGRFRTGTIKDVVLRFITA
jgi:hypothetical protein